MPFTKRPLTPDELIGLNFTAMGVVESRVPPSQWDWAVDSERRILCTQLVSSTGEMREGDYWYLLVVSSLSFIFKVDAFSSKFVAGRWRRRATLETAVKVPYDLNSIQCLASEAHQAVSYAGEELSFS